MKMKIYVLKGTSFILKKKNIFGNLLFEIGKNWSNLMLSTIIKLVPKKWEKAEWMRRNNLANHLRKLKFFAFYLWSTNSTCLKVLWKLFFSFLLNLYGTFFMKQLVSCSYHIFLIRLPLPWNISQLVQFGRERGNVIDCRRVFCDDLSPVRRWFQKVIHCVLVYVFLDITLRLKKTMQ